jgi:hypothetical protein
VDGAKNVIRTLQSNKVFDKKALQEVSVKIKHHASIIMDKVFA